jgi:predicted AAA+ superfamily ATPase
LRSGGSAAILEAEMAEIPRFFREPAGHYFLFGPRGTGKSTWLAATHPDALRVDLLAPEVHRAYAARPERLRELMAANPHASVVVIDEVQRVPALLDVVHEQIEARKGRTRFVLTGSSARKLKRAGVNLLAGRAVERTLHPFMAAELGKAFNLERALDVGLVPLVWSAADAAGARNAYLSLYVREEVQAEGMVRDLGGFARFLEAVSFSHAGVLSVTTVARECEVSRKTVEGYLEILDDLLLAFRVPVFSRKAKRHLAAHPKFFWFDTGVFRSARPAGPLDRAEEIGGAALEGLVAQHLRAWIAYSGSDLSLYFWRTKSGSEVDFVVYGRDGFWAIEVKNARRVFPGDVRGLLSFRQDYPQVHVVLLYRGSERLVVNGVLCLPVEEYLRTLRPGSPLAVNARSVRGRVKRRTPSGAAGDGIAAERR